MKDPFTLSIRSILVIGFGGLTLVGIVGSLYLGLSIAFQNTQELLSEKSEVSVTRMIDIINGRLRPVENQGRWFSDLIRERQLSLRGKNDESIALTFSALLAATPQVGGVGFFTKDGQLRQWHRKRGEISALDWSANKVVMRWLEAGSRNPSPGWGPPFWLDTLDAAVIVYETPLFDDQGYLGYFVLSVPISVLSLNLTKISANAFILNGKKDVLAHPLMINWRPLTDAATPSPDSIYSGQSALVPVDEIGDPILEKIWSAKLQDLVMLNDMVDTSSALVDYADRQYLFLYRTIKGYGPKPWHVGTYLDTVTAGGVVQRIKWAAIAGLMVFLGAVVVSLMLAHVLIRPIRSLAKASRTVQDGHLDKVPPLPASRISELKSTMSSFEGMIAGLAERELIRRTLGRYVPQSIAEKLLADDGGLTPTEASATILFADIAGFTALTEALGPTRIVEVLNAYFSRMTEIIEAQGGIITQFQGDAILAIFNIPLAVDDHATRACKAAIEMQKAVENEVFSDQKIICRIGINTGPVVAGAVGAEGRLTYTVHGDAVNRAARVEAMNKETGTTILITEATAELLDNIALEKIGEMDVRGQKNAVTVFGMASPSRKPTRASLCP